MTLKQSVGIFARTFAALSAAALVAAQAYSWATSADYRTNGILLGFAILSVTIASLVAVGIALIAQPATTRLERSVRAAVEKIIGGIGVVTINGFADVIAFGKLLPAAISAAVLAFGTTWLTYVAPAPTPPAAEVPPA